VTPETTSRRRPDFAPQGLTSRRRAWLRAAGPHYAPQGLTPRRGASWKGAFRTRFRCTGARSTDPSRCVPARGVPTRADVYQRADYRPEPMCTSARSTDPSRCARARSSA